MNKTKLFSLLAIILMTPLVFNSCCSDCGGEFFPCDPVSLSLKELPDSIMQIAPDTNAVMKFEFTSGEVSEYSIYNVRHDSDNIGGCDTARFLEMYDYEFMSNKINPKIRARKYYAYDYNSNLVPHMALQVGNFGFSINLHTFEANNRYVNDVRVHYKDFYSTIIEDAYFYGRSTTEKDQVIGVYYSPTKGIMGFYRNNDQYWRRVD